MPITTFDDISLRKKNVADSKQKINTSKTLVFAHKATAGEQGINALTLNVPTELTTKGFLNPSGAEIAAARMLVLRNNVRVISSLRGELVQYSDFVVQSSTQINFVGNLFALGGATEGEIFIVYIQAVTPSNVIVGDVKQFDTTVTVPVGQSIVNVGYTYKVNANPNSNTGDIKVYRNGQRIYRNTGNIPGGDYHYHEVDSGDGFGTTIVLNDPPTVDPELIGFDNGLMIAKGDANIYDQIDIIQGSILKLANDAALGFYGDSDVSRYTSANPTQTERRAFGDRVLAQETAIAAIDNKVDQLRADLVNNFLVNQFTATRTVVAQGVTTTVLSVNFNMTRAAQVRADWRVSMGASTVDITFGHVKYFLISNGGSPVQVASSSRYHFGGSGGGFVYTAYDTGFRHLGQLSPGSYTLYAQITSQVNSIVFNPGPTDDAGWAQSDSELAVSIVGV